MPQIMKPGATQPVASPVCIKKLHHDRNNKIKTEFHRISRKVVDYLVENDIGSLAIGHNDGWKQR
jgi:putative transposase